MKNKFICIAVIVLSVLFLVSCGKLHNIKETETIKGFESYLESFSFVEKVELEDNYKFMSSAEVEGFINIYLREDLDKEELRDFLFESVLREIMVNKALYHDLCNGLGVYHIVFVFDEQTVAKADTSEYVFNEEDNRYKSASVKKLTQWWISEIPGDPSEGLYSDNFSAVIYLSDEGYELRDRKTNNLIESKKWDELSPELQSIS